MRRMFRLRRCTATPASGTASALTITATSTLAAMVCAAELRPMALRISAVLRSNTCSMRRTSPGVGLRSTQSPTVGRSSPSNTPRSLPPSLARRSCASTRTAYSLPRSVTTRAGIRSSIAESLSSSIHCCVKKGFQPRLTGGSLRRKVTELPVPQLLLGFDYHIPMTIHLSRASHLPRSR